MINDHWNAYWKTGVKGSFGEKEPQWYKDTLEPFWEYLFSTLPGNSSILDIATGSGAVAKLAQNVSITGDKGFQITATDKANPKCSKSPSSEVEDENKIQFVFNSPVEQLNLPGLKFDLITSQFGIEYSDTKKSLATLFNILNHNGELVLIVHNTNSIICNQSKQEINQYRSIFNDQPVFKKLESLISSMGEIRSQSDLSSLRANPEVNKNRESFNRLVAKLMKHHSDGIVIADLLKQISPIFKEMNMAPVSEKLQLANSIKQNFKQAQLRLQDMLSASLDKKGVKQFVFLAEKTGFNCTETNELIDSSGRLLAWKIRLKPEGKKSENQGQTH